MLRSCGSSGVVAGYGAGDILKGVDLDVAEGSVTCLIGPNGAGKSTRAQDGQRAAAPEPRHGSPSDGQDIGQLGPRARLLLGIVHVPQERSLFPAMTVWDNLLMGGYLTARRRGCCASGSTRRSAAFPICARRAGAHAGSLSGGEQKQVELARTLLLDPALILLDEPSIGLDPQVAAAGLRQHPALAATGRTILLVEQNARSGLAASDYRRGARGGAVRLVATGRQPARRPRGGPAVPRRRRPVQPTDDTPDPAR